jgi:hypothetical protein
MADSLSADDPSLPRRARELIRLGNIGIAKEDKAAMAAFFHPQFRFHGPGGAELNRGQLWDYFASCRAAFDDFTVTRQALVSDGGDYMASRTRFAGVFARTFRGSPEGAIEPNGQRGGMVQYDRQNSSHSCEQRNPRRFEVTGLAVS